jgi:hypothetical protein
VNGCARQKEAALWAGARLQAHECPTKDKSPAQELQTLLPYFPLYTIETILASQLHKRGKPPSLSRLHGKKNAELTKKAFLLTQPVQSARKKG